MDIKFGVGGFQIFNGNQVQGVGYREFLTAFLKTDKETRDQIGKYLVAYMNNYSGVK